MPVNPASATQYKVARIVEVGDDVSRHDELIFDIRDCSPSSLSGSMHVVHHYIGDDLDNCVGDSVSVVPSEQLWMLTTIQLQEPQKSCIAF